MPTGQSDIFGSLIAIVSENQTMASILKEQCTLYGFTKAYIVSDWEALLLTLTEEIPDIIIADQIPTFNSNQIQKSLQAQVTFYDTIPVVLYSQHFDDSSQETIPEGLTIIASLRGRDEQQRLLEVIHEELERRFFDIERLAYIQQHRHLNIVVGTSDSELGASMRQVLEQERYYVSVVGNGKDALKYIEGILPQIVFLDYHLPQLNGLSVFSWMKTACPETAVIMMGEEAPPDLVAELINAGVHSYLHKPFNVSVLPTFCKELSEVTSPEDAIELEQDDQVLEEFTLLKKSEESFRALVNASGDIIFRINPQGILNFASPAVEEQLGYTRDDLEEERINIAKFVHSEDLIRVMAGIRQVIQGTSIQGLECRLMYQDRVHFRWYSINCYPLYNSQKNFIGVGGIARDITSIKQFERDIRQRNERLAALNEIARIVSQSLNLDNILNNVIDKVLEIMGFQAGSIFLSNPKTKQFVLKSCRVNTETVADKSDILNMSNIYEVLPEGVFETDVPHVVGDIFQHPKLSKTFLVEMGFRTMVTIPLKSKEMPLGMMMLLTQEQRKVNREDHELLMSIANQVGMTIENINFYQQELNARMRLEELNKLKDDFVAIVSHDLRSPLTAILGASEILLNEELMDPPLSEEQRSLVNDIQSMGTQQLHLVNDLLDLAKIESGKLELNPTMADIQTVARQCYDTMKVLANNKSIKMNFVVEPYLPKTKIDVPKIVQVINNLVGNAIKFTEIGGEVTLHLDLEDHKFLKVSVTDTGQGIEPEHLRWLFSKFTKVQRQGTGGERGTGLGLSICKNLIDLHHGEIWAESRVGVGSTFAFTLPVPERVILIIDDSLTVVKAVKDMLLKHLVHVTVKYALNGHDGLKVIEETSPVVLILDYMMPDMDGIMVFRELKNRYGTRIPPTIFLTASRDLEVRRQIFELGADDYLHKPVDVNDLLPRISRFL